MYTYLNIIFCFLFYDILSWNLYDILIYGRINILIHFDILRKDLKWIKLTFSKRCRWIRVTLSLSWDFNAEIWTGSKFLIQYRSNPRGNPKSIQISFFSNSLLKIILNPWRTTIEPYVNERQSPYRCIWFQ